MGRYSGLFSDIEDDKEEKSGRVKATERRKG
jgi:hypothetical protein